MATDTGARYTMGVGNATDGLELGWMVIGMRPRDEMIFSSHTMLATAAAIKTAGGVTIPVELGIDNLIHPDSV